MSAHAIKSQRGGRSKTFSKEINQEKVEPFFACNKFLIMLINENHTLSCNSEELGEML
jgi:hypothetical protein